jgi:methyltransferase-like protein/SAM-dependent methyltransferase
MAPNSNSYDDVPYGNLAFAQTHPDRLATMARMFGLAPPAVATSRVLELGCASGGNLIPMAFNLPTADFVGVDLSRIQVERGRDTISAMDIRNASLTHASILDVGPEWGEFDYIICHGVYSWVEPHVQDRILRIAADNLSASGVAYISYNTYPGWHMRDVVRHMMRYHAGRFDGPAEQIEQARALLNFVASTSRDTEPYGQLLRREIERLSQSTDWYLYHEHLEALNLPLYFHQFIERAEQAGLQYLAEADVSDMLSSVFPASVAATLERISPDILHLEQYMDFVRNRQFRQTLLCHKDVRPKRALSPAFLHGLMLSCRAVTEPAPPDLTPMKPVVFTKGAQRAEVALPASKAALALLMEAWPRAIDVDELCTMALERAAPFLSETPVNDARGAMMSDLFTSVMHGLIQLHTQQTSCTNRPSDLPRANALAAHQAEAGHVVVNARHEMFQLEPLGRAVLKLANGARRRCEIADELLQSIERGALTLGVTEGEAPTGAALRAALDVELERSIASLTRSALFVE